MSSEIKNLCLEKLLTQLISSVMHRFNKKLSPLHLVNTAYIIPFCTTTLNKGNMLRMG